MRHPYRFRPTVSDALEERVVPSQGGPSLSAIVGSKAGAVPGFNFSPAMKNANVTWDDASLDKFLANPSGFVHGTRMFANLPASKDRDDVIAYLNTLKK